ncbi:MAG: hypothetical protein HZB56_09130 [Deltaproteobacteria bacterium]|nr:hypothetical protein [Deltaproteobacteria bacterium]
MDFVERVILRLREQPGFSRNRHYQAFSSPEGKRALRIHRHLRSLEQALAAGARATLEQEGERLRLTLTGARYRRVAFLTQAELRILCRNPEARAALPLPGGW